MKKREGRGMEGGNKKVWPTSLPKSYLQVTKKMGRTDRDGPEPI